MTKLVCISDTHGCLPGNLPDGDILIHAGDWCAHSTFDEVREFLMWFERQPHKHRVFIAGNHDRITESHSMAFRGLREKYAPTCHYLQDSEVNCDGLTIWGSPVSPRFYNWAWNRDRGEDIRRHWDLIPTHIDVLITHGPPFGFLDLSNNWNEATGKKFDDHLGCRDLLDAMYRVKPLVHIFGHIHGSGGKQVEYIHDCGHRTRLVNASLMDEAYIPNHKPVVVNSDMFLINEESK